MPEDPKARFCESNGCNALDGEAYKAIAQLSAAMRLAKVLIEVGSTSWEAAAEVMSNPVSRRIAERIAGMTDARSDATWAMTVYLMRGDAVLPK